jgi:hypothetical protein
LSPAKIDSPLLDMKTATTAKTPSGPQPHNSKVIPWIIVGLVIGLILGIFWGRRQGAQGVPTNAATEQGLSDATRTILQKLEFPVELRFYAPAALDDLPEPLAAFASRVKQLLTKYEREAGGKIELRSLDPSVDATSKASAGVDGLLAFAGKDGAACYLGISVLQSGKRQTLPQLSPEWEIALESDLSRAIARVAASPVPSPAASRRTTVLPEPVNPAITEEVLRTIPDLESRSFEEAAKILREAALAEFTAQANEMQSKLGEAQRHVLEAQQKNSEPEQQTAVRQLQRIQSEQTDKLKEITARLQSRMNALNQLKGRAPAAQ